jgi:type IV secretory pathway VirB4 component
VRSVLNRRRKKGSAPMALIGPDTLEVRPRRLQAGDTWCETLAVTGYPREVTPGWLQPLLAYPGAVDVALHVEPIPSELASSRLRHQLARLESSRRLDEKHSKLPDPSLEVAVSDAFELSRRLARGEDRLFRVGLYVTVRAGSEEALDEQVSKVRSLAASLLLDARSVTFRPLEGFVSTLPLGLDALKLRRTFDTRALATTFPFDSAEIENRGGVLVGRNVHSGSLVFYDRFGLDNYNQVVLATSGAGKSYLAKLLVLRSLFEGAEVLVIDPESEYERLAEAVGGTTIRLGAKGQFINPLDLRDAGGQDALRESALFCHAVCSTLLGGTSAEERAELDRAILSAYEGRGITSDPRTHERPPPLLADVVSELGTHGVAGSTARRLEPFVSGSHRGLFEAPTTITPTGHLVVLSLRDLPESPEELRAAGTLLALDVLWRRVRFGPSRPRIVVIDEAWTMLGDDSASRFLLRLAKSARKYWCGLTTVTQDVGDVLASDLGSAVLNNAATKVLLQQSSEFIGEVARTFRLSEGECSYLVSCEPGHGLFCAGRERVALEVIASEEEHRLVTSRPDELDAMGESS